MQRCLRHGLVVACVIAASACGSDDSSVAPDGSAFDRCDGSEVSVYSDGLTFETDAGLYSVSFRGASPAPPARGDNAWTVAVSDASGKPVNDADVTVTPTMPTHGHGTSPSRFAAVRGAADGVYELPPMDLFMPGPWKNLFTITAGADRDSGDVWFCIPR